MRDFTLPRLRDFFLSLAVGVVFIGGFFLLIILVGSWFDPNLQPDAVPTWLLYVAAPFGLWHLWLMGPGLPAAMEAVYKIEVEEANRRNLSNGLKCDTERILRRAPLGYTD